jgi:hypothetical protein
MLVLIKLTSAGVDAGPFNLYSNTDGFVTPFVTGISKATLLSGYLSSAVPNGSTVVRCVSTGTCTNYVDFNITTGLTTTTTTTIPGTTTTTTTSGGGTTTSTTTPAPSAVAKIQVIDRPNQLSPSEPVQCDGTIPPTMGTRYKRQTFIKLLDQYNNPISVGYNVTAIIDFVFDQCGAPMPVTLPTTFTVLAGGIQSSIYDYTSSTLVDCGQSDCGPETTTFDAPVSNSISVPFVVSITP